ncbi:release factor glutamine methyltransferase [Halalkaliarchaeum desulfuricum]|uniref:Release factor glutamine methyltransferase n=1 Tax=Halalkaliarchaeum desulfuricum TaxID=2055893 RepID=A0A343THQ4_9EURY|nr:HemK2/MTQ2 family protein methyltransferase [Halalkaliarchaeum desulfuricum]AUX08626.1 release factor glutamine methyltransferase [Halalkaliarchaeum desulfuricum]
MARPDDLAERRGLETDVYQPAEDSALLASATVEAVEAGDAVLEVGTGSGWVAAQVRETREARVIAADVNPHACRQARDRGLEVVRADLVSPFRTDSFDVVTFNPPYLPTDPDNEWDDWMEAALSGGETGRRLVEPFLEEVGRVLASSGCVLLLVSSLTDREVVESIAADAGFETEAVREESYPFETLWVLRLFPVGPDTS